MAVAVAVAVQSLREGCPCEWRQKRGRGGGGGGGQLLLTCDETKTVRGPMLAKNPICKRREKGQEVLLELEGFGSGVVQIIDR